MPQMATIKLFLLFIIFSITFIMFNIMNYYNFIYKPSNSTMTYKTMSSFNWKW